LPAVEQGIMTHSPPSPDFPSPEFPSPDFPSPDAALADADAALRRARAALVAEIAAYPTPIAGCDAQFNHLLALRRQVSEAIRALETPVFVPTPRSPHPGAGVESR
jgi:hypothetical protein